uniref:HDC18159 n=1 Tax=Drosophila melanogaster TaxID=7227 RepID=Q6III3_DROME|nr:TPA_inf: HDC18159 [Drosophila melanogaster]
MRALVTCQTAPLFRYFPRLPATEVPSWRDSELTTYSWGPCALYGLAYTHRAHKYSRCAGPQCPGIIVINIINIIIIIIIIIIPKGSVIAPKLNLYFISFSAQFLCRVCE